MISKVTSGEVCRAAIVKAADDMDSKAKRIAYEVLNRPCLEPPNWGERPLIFEVVNP